MRLLGRVRDLSWDTRFEDKPLKARTGFEPVFSEEGDEGSLGREQAAAQEPELPAELLRIVQRLTQASRKGARES